MDNALLRIPVLEETGLKKLYNGPESFTPDNQFILGEAPEVRELLRRRRASTPSASRRPAARAGRWPSGSSTVPPTSDLTSVDIRRFAPFNGNNRWLHDRVAEILGLHYEIPWPNREMTTARPFRRSPVHHLLVAAERQLRQPDGLGAGQLLRPGRCRRRSSSTPGASRTGCRGRRPNRPAPAPASRCSTRRRSRSTCWSGPTPRRRCSGCAPPTWPSRSAGRSTPECSTSAAPTSPTSPSPAPRADEFLIVSSAATTERDKDHIRKNLPAGARAALVDVTSSLRGVRRDGTAVAGPAEHADRRRPVRRRVPVRHQPADHAGLLDRSRDPHHLRRRARAGNSTCPPSSRSACTRT